MARIDDRNDDLSFAITHRPTFGGAMVSADGRPSGSRSQTGSVVEPASSDRPRLRAVPRAGRLRSSTSAPEGRSHVVLPADLVGDDDQRPQRLAVAHHTASASRTNGRPRRLERQS